MEKNRTWYQKITVLAIVLGIICLVAGCDSDNKANTSAKEYSKWQCGKCSEIVKVLGNNAPSKNGCPKAKNGKHEWLLMGKHLKQ